MRRTAAVLAVLVVSSACGSSPAGTPQAGPGPISPTPTGSADGTCSASGSERPGPQELPEAVAQTRERLLDAALACDWQALGELAGQGAEQFSFSFGGLSDPVAHWQEQEARGEQPLRSLVEVLRLEPRERPEVDQHVWPAAFGYDRWEDVPQEQRQALAELYSAEDRERFAEFGAYVGYRVGISGDGEWLFFVAGD